MRGDDENADWCSRSEGVRNALKLNQQSFGSLLRIGMDSVRRWKNGQQVPDKFGKLLIELLEGVLSVQPRLVVIESLRKSRAERLSIVRTLTWLGSRPRLSEPVDAVATSPPRWIIRREEEEEESLCERVQRLLRALGINQQDLATLIGVSFATVCRWKRSLVDPADFGQLTLELLSNAIKGHPAETVTRALRAAGSRHAEIAKTLTWLERHPTLPEPSPRPSRASSPPPFDAALLAVEPASRGPR
ncbi:MAG: helix-turn-helix transcriptional regulator [Polyangiaceae bacterium]|nr:helix-turn-helix transcriptional regulator [Polyangiaceae bacterium]